MKIRLGYACISETLNITTSSPYTYTKFKKEQDYLKLDKIIKSNLLNLYEILKFNQKNNIHFYRLSSALIPLATKKEIDFEYIHKYKNYYHLLSKVINENHMRIDFHPDQFCVLNSTNPDVIENTIEILKYHYSILEALHISPKVLVLHIGSNAFGKENSIKRFIYHFNQLENKIKESIVIENDDKIFNIIDCLTISKKCNIPIVLDYHHHSCNGNGIELKEHIEDIFATWKNINPKIHFSTPKNKTKKEMRSHHDYIESDSFIAFIESIKHLNYDIDIMIEAKKKEEALFRLIRELKYKTNYQFIDDTSFIV